ncbi:hypothetical protein [Alloacidobacterium sp.]|uniref:hypothetical protein n=1 Tax=Alloacidobacterium sp. TaxID=2951999 RepID=UPI002D502950|nr:hypothetical protein [Alloacidobacterium sp.]HYK37718.1 hypothetical protein [Alloacidobacterium sp.]
MGIFRPRYVALVTIAFLAASSYADKLKNFYMGSGGYSAEVHRVVFLELAKDGTAILQQNWHEKDPEVWHLHWKLNKKSLVLDFDPVDGRPTPSQATFTLKNNSLIPVKWDSQFLGILGPPTLMPFSSGNNAPGSVSGCKLVDYTQPTGCIQWDSRDMKK